VCESRKHTSPYPFGSKPDENNVSIQGSIARSSELLHRTRSNSRLTRVGCAGGRREAKGIRKKITEMKMRLIKVALKATGRGYALS